MTAFAGKPAPTVRWAREIAFAGTQGRITTTQWSDCFQQRML
ncbi:hypothetical protein ACXM5X_17200 [Pseudomonas saponiphila]|uniref:Uncharacterized protein n=1 Tax=Pseudomonas saponiphila TaxID=556534 RepID=A0A1H4QKB5_9PSED|nr:hypothetical protein [Pseudomonas saponiphila]SEC20019.1 hypothetical protein SAMN05216178_3807 [Pseudomonas saponiphila]